MLGASERMVGGLVSMLYTNDVSVRLAACAAIAALSQNHVHNASLLAMTRGLLLGLRHALVCKRFDSLPSLNALDAAEGDHVGGGEVHADAVVGAGDSQGVSGDDSPGVSVPASAAPVAGAAAGGAGGGTAAATIHTLAAQEGLGVNSHTDSHNHTHDDTHNWDHAPELAQETALDIVELKEVACQAMVHLAMQNHGNKLAIVRCPGVLPALRHALLDSEHPDLQDTAAMVIANCADNFAAQGGQEAAQIIVATPGLLSALCSLVRQSVASFADSADRSAGLAAVISLSDHPCILDHLRAQAFPQALDGMLQVTLHVLPHCPD